MGESEANAIIAADVVLFAQLGEPDAAVLLIRRRWEPFAESWALPGGHVDPEETAADGARRELEEETGIALDPAGMPLDFVGYYDAPDRDPRRPRVVSLAFRAELDHPVEPLAGNDAAEAHWVRLDDIQRGDVTLAFDHLRIILDAFEEVNNTMAIRRPKGQKPTTPKDRANRIAAERLRRGKVRKKQQGK